MNNLINEKYILDTNKRLLILGCEGHSKVVTDIAHSVGFNDIIYEDPNSISNFFLGGKVFKSINEKFTGYFFVAIGDNFKREKVTEAFSNSNHKSRNISLIHPSSIISPRSLIGEGTVIMPLCVVNSCTEIGTGVIINTRSSIDHDNCLKNYSSIAPGVTTSGNVTVGERTFISIGTSVKHNINIGNDVVVGASSLVLKNISNNEVFYGSPAKFIRKRNKGEKYL